MTFFRFGNGAGKLLLCLFLVLGVGAPSVSPAQPADSLIEKAREAWRGGYYTTVIDQLHPFLEGQSAADSPQVYLLLGRSHQKLRQHEAATRAFEAALQNGGHSVRVLSALAESYAHLGKLDKAESAQRRALKQDTTSRQHHLRLRLARIYEKQRDWSQAAQTYRSLLKQDASNTTLRHRLARAEAKQNRTDTALVHYRTAHRTRPQDPTIAQGLTRLLVETEQYAEALQVTKRSLSAHPQRASLWRRQANVAFELDSLVLAEKAYERTLQNGDSSTTVLQRLGIVRVGQKKHEKALSPLKTAYDRDTTRTATCFYLGAAYRGVDDLQKAITFYDRAIDNASAGVLTDALTQAAQTHDALDQLPDALRAYRTVLRLQPDKIEIDFYLATLYDSYYKDKSVAARYYNLFLEHSMQDDSRLHAYARKRLDSLRPTLHFQQATDAN